MIVSVIILVFLWHIPSAIIPVITIPVAILISFIPMKAMGLTSNIMSLGGIAIAIGAMVDAAIVVVEQTHKKLEEWERTGRKEDYHRVVIDAVKEVGGPSFFALLVIAVSFLPVLTLEAQEGRLFKPLAYTKNLSMIVAAVLAITLDPAMRLLFTHMRNFEFRPRWLARAANAVLVGKIHSEDNHPISRVLIRLYDPVCAWSLRWKWLVIAAAIAVVAVTVPVYQKLGSEFMPPLDEGTLLYMPSTLPGISVTEAQQLMQVQDRIIKQFPEVERVFGKGRPRRDLDRPGAALDDGDGHRAQAADQWRKGDTWYSSWAPEWASGDLPAHHARSHLHRAAGRRDERGAEASGRLQRLDHAHQRPHRHADHRHPHAGRHQDLRRRHPADRADRHRDRETASEGPGHAQRLRRAHRRRLLSGFRLEARELARYGLSIDDAQDVVMSAIGGENVTTTVEGRERYPVNVRYMRDFRSDLDKLSRVLIPVMGGRRRFRFRSWPTSSSLRARPCSATRTGCSTATCTWTWRAATSAATSRRPRRWSARR